MNEEEVREIIDNMSEQELNDFIFFALQEVEKENQKLKTELKKKDNMINEIQREIRDHIGFENRLKRDNKEPDLFNQGRFYVANNINNILRGK